MVRPHRLRTAWLVAGVVFTATAAAGQSPPPNPLPPTVTNNKPPAGSPVSPASGAVTQSTAPIARFQDLKSFPAETVQAVYSVRSGSEWLWRMNQANGRFIPGIHPALRQPLNGDLDLHQAYAALALAEAARFTGEERYAARATQAVLALLALTRTDESLPGQRVPVTPSSRCNRVAFAAVTIQAIHALPSAEVKLKTDADGLAAFVLARINQDGSFQLGDTADEAVTDPEEARTYPGLALQALVSAYRAKPDEAKRAALARVVGHYREAFKANPHPQLAAALVPALAELAQMTEGDSALTAAVFDMTDFICRCQYTRNDARNPLWMGGFRPAPTGSDAEPGIDSANCLTALAAAVRVTRRSADVVRFRTYRQALVDGLAFTRGLQFTDENADHFERSFRARFLVGGAHLGPADGTVRIDATARLVSCQIRYLESGAESQPQ